MYRPEQAPYKAPIGPLNNKVDGLVEWHAD